LAAAPELRINIVVALQEAKQQLAQAEAVVATTAASMGRAMKKGFVSQFDEAMGAAGRSARRFGQATQLATAAAAAATGDLEGALKALPGPIGAAGSAGLALGELLHEAFTGARAEAESLANAVAQMEKASGFKAQAREAERLLAIEQEVEPIRKLELERMRELAEIRAKVREADTEGAVREAVAAAAAEERLVNAQYDNKIREHNLKLAEEARKADEAAAAEAQKVAEQEAAKTAQMMEQIRRGEQMLTIARMDEQIANAANEIETRRLEMEKALYEIEQDRLDNAEEMSEELANQIADAQRGMMISRERKSIEEEIAAKQAELDSMQDQAQRTTQVESSFGGALVVANASAQRSIAQTSEKAVKVQEQIRDLVKRLAEVQGLGGIQ
jgi:hypothetical protein